MQARDSEKACGHFKHCKKSFRNCLCRLVKLSVSSLNLSVGKHLNKSFFFLLVFLCGDLYQIFNEDLYSPSFLWPCFILKILSLHFILKITLVLF